MAGISPILYQKLRKTLLMCGPFESDRDLRITFVDTRLFVWRDRLPEASTATARAQNLISFLIDKYNNQGENALVLFLHVLQEQISPNDACHSELATLAYELEAELRSDIMVKPTPSATAIEVEKQAAKYRASGQLDRAIRQYQASLEHYRESGDKSAEIRILNTIGSLYRDQGNLSQAQEYFKENLAIARSSGSQDDEANALQNLGSLLRAAGDIAKAMVFFNQAEAIWRSLGDNINLANVYTEKGLTLLAKEDIQAAEREFLRALHLSKDTGNIVEQATILTNLAIIASQQKEWEEAIALYKQALQIYEQQQSKTSGDFSNITATLGNLGDVYANQRQWAEALETYRRALTFARRSEDPMMEATTLSHIGNVLVEQEALEEVVQTYEQAQRIYRRLGDGTSFRRLQDNIKAIERLGSRIARVRSFFEAAGFHVDAANELGTFICRPTTSYWRNRLKQAIYTCVFVEKPLDREDVLNIHKAAEGLSKDFKQAFVLIDQTVGDHAWTEIWALRAFGFDVMPITSTVLYESRSSDEPFAERMELAKHLQRFLTKSDPYNMRHPIWGRLDFFGRETLSQQLIKQLTNGRPVGLFGLRKIGKSSLMRYMQPLMPYPTAWIDLQAGFKDLVHLYERILHAWHKDAQVKFDLDLGLLDVELNSENPSGDFSKLIRHTLSRLSAQEIEDRLTIFLDEIELLFPPSDASSSTLARYFSLMRMLRGLVQEDGRLSLMVAGVDPTINRVNRLGSEKHQNPFYKLLTEIYLPPLTTEDCSQMVRNIGLQVDLSYTDSAVLAVSRYSGGHPFLARQLCSLAYKHLNYEPGEISLTAIQKAAQQFLFDPEYATFLDDVGLWGEISSVELWGEKIASANQSVLSRLAQCSEPCPESSIIRSEEGDVASFRTALYALRQLHIIKSDDEDLEPNYSITFGLFHSWIRQVRLGLEE
jgi:tetratricopeptide (TPR) repeat protein